MKQPLDVKIDRELNPSPVYIRYSHERVAHTDSIDPDGAVNVDRDAAGNVIGVELLAVDEYTLGIAREIARMHDLVLPDLLAAA